MFEQPQLAGLLPLLPLTKHGQNLETVERMVDKMEQAGMYSQLWLAENIAGLVLKSEHDKQRIKERFTMLGDIIKESWVYQETIEEGKAKGIAEGKVKAKKEDLLQFVEVRFQARFPALLAQAKGVLEQKTSVEQIQVILPLLYQANTIEEAQAALLTRG